MGKEYDDYCANASKIYAKLADTTGVMTNGLVPHPEIFKRHSGIFIALRYSPDAIAPFAERSAQIGERMAPCVSYPGHQLHTSFPTTKRIWENDIDPNALEAVCQGVGDVFPSLKRPSVTYTGLRVTPDAVIAAGVPDEAFFNGAQAVKASVNSAIKDINAARVEAKKQPYEFGIAFGPSITMDRFLVPSTPQEIANKKLLDLLAPIEAVMRPTSLAVGYWQKDYTPGVDLWQWPIVKEFQF